MGRLPGQSPAEDYLLPQEVQGPAQKQSHGQELPVISRMEKHSDLGCPSPPCQGPSSPRPLLGWKPCSASRARNQHAF